LKVTAVPWWAPSKVVAKVVNTVVRDEAADTVIVPDSGGGSFVGDDTEEDEQPRVATAKAKAKATATATATRPVDAARRLPVVVMEG
jgi:C4-type Zn-finger protein